MSSTASHPKGLWVLFFTEMWERFSFYGMRALLVLYLTSKLIDGGFEFGELKALEIYAVFTSLIYLTPIIGGMIADRLMGQRKMIYIGALAMAIGQACMALSESSWIVDRQTWLFWGLGMLVIGNGFFKPNISTVVGRLYADGDPRKDGGFTIFYMGINLGAFMSPIIAGTLGETVGWSWGFASAAVGMLIGTVWFAIQSHKLGNLGFEPTRKFVEGDVSRITKNDWFQIGYWTLGTFTLVGAFISVWWKLPSSVTMSIIVLAGILAVSVIGYTIFKNTSGSVEWSRIGAILIFAFFNIFFWVGFEQAGGTFNIFAKELTDRSFFNWEIPASLFQSINAIAIVAFAPLFSLLWVKLGKYNPSTPLKFALALALLGVGFVVMNIAASIASPANLVSPMWLVMVYVIHTTGELCLSPVGLSMISKLSPPRITSLMMGLWFASFALAYYFAGTLKSILQTNYPDMPLYLFLVITSFSAATLLLLVSPFLKKMMRGID